MSLQNTNGLKGITDLTLLMNPDENNQKQEASVEIEIPDQLTENND